MLPKIDYPIQEVTVPATGAKVRLRMMRAREEKMLLMAQTTNDYPAMLLAIKQVVNNCLIEPTRLTLFDLEYLFLKLRAMSISNVSRVSYRDGEDDQVYDFEIDLDKVEVQFPAGKAPMQVSGGGMTLVLQWPSEEVYSDRKVTGNEAPMEYLIAHCIREIQQDMAAPIDASKMSIDELKEFVLDLDTKTYTSLISFLGNMPRLYYKIEYTNSMGNPREIELSTLEDFFTLR